MHIHNRFREIVASQHITFAELSRRSGVSFSTVYGCARGAVPGPVSRQRIATALGRPEDELFGAGPTAAPPGTVDVPQGR